MDKVSAWRINLLTGWQNPFGALRQFHSPIVKDNCLFRGMLKHSMLCSTTLPYAHAPRYSGAIAPAQTQLSEDN